MGAPKGFLAALFFLFGCSTDHEQLYQLMRKGKVENNHLCDTLYLVDSILPIVTLQHGKQRQKWLIDTGLPCLSPAVKPQVHLPLMNAEGDTLANSFGQIQAPLIVGKRVITDLTAGLPSASANRMMDSIGVQGILGANLMQHSTWHFDWKRRIVIIAPSTDQFEKQPSSVAISFNRTIHRVPKCQVKFNRFPYQLVGYISTGFAGGVLLDEEFSGNYTSFMYEYPLQGLHWQKGLHQAKALRGRLTDSICIEGSIRYDRLPVGLSQSKYGLLGLALLQRQNITLDWKKRKMWLHGSNLHGCDW